MYYFDHSATTPLHPDVVELMHNIQKYKFGNPSSTHKKGREAKLIIESSRNQIKKMFVTYVVGKRVGDS